MSSQRMTIHPKEAAALDRLLDAYLATVGEADDPGYHWLGAFRSRLQHREQDHSDYIEATR